MIEAKSLFDNHVLIYDYEINNTCMPVLPQDYNILPQFVPDKRLMRYFKPDVSITTFPIGWYQAYLYILLCLRILWYAPLRSDNFVFNPVDTWNSLLDVYTFSREFLEYLLEDLIKEEQNEGALLVIKKLSEMDEEGERFVI